MKRSIVVFALVLAASPALADEEWSLEDRTRFEELAKEIQQYADLTNKACSTAITFTLDKRTFKDAFNSGARHGLDVFRLDAIVEPFRQVRYICLEGKTGAKAVAKKIKTLKLGFGAPPKRALVKGTFAVHVPKGGNKRQWSDDLNAFLKKKL